MRQDYINDLADPVGRAMYIEADGVDRWAPKLTRCFEHSPEVFAAWNALADAVRGDAPGTYLNGPDDAIADHLTATIPALIVDSGSSIQVTSRELVFGPGWSADEVARLVAVDFIPDATLCAALEAARTSPGTLEAIRNSARKYDDADRAQHARPFENGYAGQLAAGRQQLHVAAAFYRPANSTYPAHISVELTVEREFNPATLARSDSAHQALHDGNLQVEMSIHNVATAHLRELSGTSARIDDDGYAVTIEMNLPTRPEHGGTDTLASTTGKAEPALTADQQALLPDLTTAIETCLPAHLQQHTHALAHGVAREVPTTADAVAAYEKVTLAEIIEHHERRTENYSPHPVPQPASSPVPERPVTPAGVPGTITYEPVAGFGGKLTMELPFDAPAPRGHLLTAAMAVRPDAGSVAVEYHLDEVATRHLRDALGTTAFITHNGQQTHAFVYLPTALAERPPMYGGMPPYIDTERRALTSEQEAILPDVVETIRDIVPAGLGPHVHDIAHLAAQEIPAQADLLRAYQRTSIPEILSDYDRAGEPAPLPQELQQLVKSARLSFPQHASEALKNPPSALPTSPARATSGTPTSRGYER